MAKSHKTKGKKVKKSSDEIEINIKKDLGEEAIDQTLIDSSITGENEEGEQQLNQEAHGGDDNQFEHENGNDQIPMEIDNENSAQQQDESNQDQNEGDGESEHEQEAERGHIELDDSEDDPDFEMDIDKPNTNRRTRIKPQEEELSAQSSPSSPQTHSQSSLNTKRAGFTNREKKALRDWVQSQETKPSQKQCIDWFLKHFNRRISQSGVSRCLSEKSKHLDSEVVNETSIRNRYGKYPVLEDMLVDWQLYQSKTGGAVTAALLLRKAKELWYRIPEYRGIEPEFNYRWLDRFRKRHNIEYSPGRVGNGGAGRRRAESVLEGLAESRNTTNPILPLSADSSIVNTDPALFNPIDSKTGVEEIINNENENENEYNSNGTNSTESLRSLQALCAQYDPSNIYTVLETGFFWRKSLSLSNSIQTLLPKDGLGYDRDNDVSSVAAVAALALAAEAAATGGDNSSIHDDVISPELAVLQKAAAEADAADAAAEEAVKAVNSNTNTANEEESSVTAEDVARSVLAQKENADNTNLLEAAAAVAASSTNPTTTPSTTTHSASHSSHHSSHHTTHHTTHHSTKLNSDARSDKFTVILSSNCSGTDRIPINFIAAERPNSLDNVNLSGINAAWITRRIAGLDVFTMRKWLSEFVSHIRLKPGSRSKRYLLVLYKTPVHEDAVKLVFFPPNIRVEFINPRAQESGGLPLEQEVVQRWKLNYSYHWLKYILDSYNGLILDENNSGIKDPLETVKVFQSIQWAVQSWYHEISDSVFRNAFIQSALNRTGAQLEPTEELPNIDLLCQAIKHTGRIPDIMDVDEFLNSDFDIPDIVDDSEGDLLDAIVERRLGHAEKAPSNGSAFTSLYDDSNGLDDIPDGIPTIDQAQEYITELIRWSVHQRTLSKAEIFPLLSLQSFINRRKVDEIKRNEEVAVAAATTAAAFAAAAIDNGSQ